MSDSSRPYTAKKGHISNQTLLNEVSRLLFCTDMQIIAHYQVVFYISKAHSHRKPPSVNNNYLSTYSMWIMFNFVLNASK